MSNVSVKYNENTLFSNKRGYKDKQINIKNFKYVDQEKDKEIYKSNYMEQALNQGKLVKIMEEISVKRIVVRGTMVYVIIVGKKATLLEIAYIDEQKEMM